MYARTWVYLVSLEVASTASPPLVFYVTMDTSTTGTARMSGNVQVNNTTRKRDETQTRLRYEWLGVSHAAVCWRVAESWARGMVIVRDVAELNDGARVVEGDRNRWRGGDFVPHVEVRYTSGVAGVWGSNETLLTRLQERYTSRSFSILCLCIRYIP